MNSKAKPCPYLKASAWLRQYGSHDVYSFEGVKEDFKNSTGQDLPSFVWPTTVKTTRQAMKQRGLGGELSAKLADTDRVIWGYRLAEQFARHLVKFSSDKMGRGRVFYECIEALEKAGL